MTITLDQMAQAARDLVAAEEATAAAELALKEVKEKERQLREETVPGMFAELGVDKLVLKDGSVFSCTQEVYASIPAARKEEAFKWLEEHDFGGLIKTEVQVAFGKGEIEQARALLDELATLGIENGVIDRSIHPQTLKAFLKEQLAAQAERVDMESDAWVDAEDDATDLEERLEAALDDRIDLELFGARPVMTAKVKVPKAKKEAAGPYERGPARSYPGAGQVRTAEWRSSEEEAFNRGRE